MKVREGNYEMKRKVEREGVEEEKKMWNSGIFWGVENEKGRDDHEGYDEGYEALTLFPTLHIHLLVSSCVVPFTPILNPNCPSLLLSLSAYPYPFLCLLCSSTIPSLPLSLCCISTVRIFALLVFSPSHPYMHDHTCIS